MSRIGLMIKLFNMILRNKTVWNYIQETVNEQSWFASKSGEDKIKDARAKINEALKADGTTVRGWLINLGIELAVAKIRQSQQSKQSEPDGVHDDLY